MSEKTTNHMIGYDTTAQIWVALNEYYTALNSANISLYKTQLRNIKMTGSLNDYLLKIKGIIDLLATIGHKQSHHDHIEAIFNGLPSVYDAFVTSVTTRKDDYTVAEMEALLMAQSVRIEKNTKSLDINKVEANLAHNKLPFSSRNPFSGSQNSSGINRSSSQFRSSDHGFSMHGTSRGGYSSTRGLHQFSGNRNVSGRPPQQSWNQKLQCQLCHKMGHTVKQCFYRFDKSFMGPESFRNMSSAANLAKMQACLASSETVADDSWYPDSGATHHLTPDGSNLASSSSYTGSEQIHMGNGTGLHIEHIGNSSLVSPF